MSEQPDPYRLDLDPIATRQWCEQLARVLPGRKIEPHGKPYLERYYVAGWSPVNRIAAPSVYLHHFVASDPDDAMHSHPWAWSLSIILIGGYREQRCLPHGALVERTYYPGDQNLILAADRHRVDLLEGDCWTLFLTGPFLQQWQFYPLCEGDQ